MKTNSNSYTIIYSVIIVVIVAFLLAFVSSSLKATQDANVALDTQKQILNSLNLRDLDNATAAAKYKEVVKDEKEKSAVLPAAYSSATMRARGRMAASAAL